ncbi:Pleckstrin homology domain-containing family G member 1 [Geodia barretti]|uniref:Pleckstrin homology domain-containing family G member 1 n=1 Tax=Geodia barretti TaxID=519541 RepID=A0AA35S8C5_GEOBA|nr:Pleckstrin homology domain-containing family G member 1 [Geodia barretti]
MCQQQLNHMLPLGAYLLKPVQRVMKYPLLLRQLIKNMCVDDHGFSEVSSAIDIMTSVSKHINEMKEEYDADVYVRGLDNLIKGCEGVVDLVTAGGLMLEWYSGPALIVSSGKSGNLRYAGGRSTIPSLRSRADRHLYTFLFKRLMLLTKKDDDGYQYKTHLEIADIQLSQRVEKETSATFQVRQVSTGNFYNLQARMLIMAGFPTDNSSKRLRNESSQAQTSRNTRAKHRKRSSTSPGSLTSQLVQASLVATLQLEPFQEQSGEQHNEGAEVCNSAESIVDDLMELAIETPEKKTKDTTSGEAPQMLHLSPARVKRSEKKKSVVDATEQLTKYDDEPCQPFSKGFSGCRIVQNLSIVKEANSKQKTAEDNMSIDGDEVTVPHLTVYCTSTEQPSDTSLCLNQGDMQTLKVLLCISQESVTETDEESLGTPRLAPPLEFTDDYIDSMTNTGMMQCTHVGRGLDDDEFVLPESNMCQSKVSNIGVSTPRNPPTDHTQKSILNWQTSPTCLKSQSIHCQEQFCLCEASIISKTCTTHEKQNTVLHTNIEHYSSPKLEEHQHSSPSLENRGMFPFVLQQSQTQKAAKPTLRHMNPYTGNPEEELSFDEVLQHYDNYASSTGKTARSWCVNQLSGSPSLPKGEKRRKDRKRSMTVASFDRKTLLAAVEGTFSQPSTESPKKPHSKVQHLAREYSRRIKDNQMNKHSPVNDKVCALPNWVPEGPVERLVKGNKETTNHPVENLSWMSKKDSGSSPTLHPEQTSMTVYHIPPTDVQLQTSPTTNTQSNKGLKGLVKSLVVKFGGGK